MTLSQATESLTGQSHTGIKGHQHPGRCLRARSRTGRPRMKGWTRDSGCEEGARSKRRRAMVNYSSQEVIMTMQKDALCELVCSFPCAIPT